MEKSNTKGGGKVRSPSYYIWRRFLRHKPALAGAVYIFLSAVVALAGYLIMPDQTPDANDGAVQIGKKPPGFHVQLIKVRKNQVVPARNFLEKMVYGQASAYIIEPITDYSIEGMTVRASVYGRADYIVEYDLLDVVMCLSIDDPAVSIAPEGQITDDSEISYTDIHNDRHTVRYGELVGLFEQNNIQSRKYLLGTDRSGRDLLSRLIFGTRVSMSIGFMAVLISMFIGICVGALGGFFGGSIDAVVMWLMSVVWSVPAIMLVMAISMVLQAQGYWVAFTAVGLTMWVEVARLVRGQVMAMKEKQFVEAARAYGAGNHRLMFVHILPNISGSLIVVATINFASAILLEAGLSFLGLSVQPPTPSWGGMIYEGFQAVGTRNSTHLILFPSLAISIIVLAFNMLGSGLRDAYDPRATI
jgi:peptide/nickel transport system permease protein